MHGNMNVKYTERHSETKYIERNIRNKQNT
jgi:hypothetical protein